MIISLFQISSRVKLGFSQCNMSLTTHQAKRNPLSTLVPFSLFLFQHSKQNDSVVGGSAEFFASGLRLRLVLQTSGITVVRLGTHTLALSSFYAYRPFFEPFPVPRRIIWVTVLCCAD